ncbi:MAG: Gfo/Idh/MocA family oxidoreductase [Rhodococcus fascians]
MTETHSPSPLRVGLIGAGAIAQIAQLPALAGMEGVTIAGVVTASPESTARNVQRWPIERGYASAEEMIDGADLDAVFVLTRKHDHLPYVRMGLDAGLDVFCEKPLATSLADAREMVDLADAAPGLVMVGFNRRYAEVYRTAHEQYGAARPDLLVAQKNRRGSEYRATLENGIHMVDLMRWFGGEAVEVTATSHGDDPYREDGTAALIRFDSGTTGIFVAARSAGEWDERLELYGGLRTVRVIAPDSVTVIEDGVSSTQEVRPRAAGWADITTTGGFGPAVDHFLSCVRTRRTPLTNALEAYRSQELMDRILAAAGLPTEDSEDLGDGR